MRVLLCVLCCTTLSAAAESSVAAAPESIRLQTILDGFEQNVRKAYEAVAPEIRDQIRVDFSVTPQMLLANEIVTVTLRARSTCTPNPILEVWEGSYAAEPEIETVTLDWVKQEGDDAFQATWNWKPARCGNYLLHWRCDIGGDIPEFWRNVSVVDKGWAVLILNSTSHIQPRPEPDFHELHLPFSYWAEILLYGAMPYAENFLAFSRGARQYGDDPGMLIFMGGEYLKDDKTVFYDEPESVQCGVLQCYQEFWPMLGFPKPLNSLYTYGMGNGPARVSRELGLNLLGALCADQNWGDGPFKINHWGMPARPYFVSEEDFRKPGPGGAGAMVGVQQCERQTVLCRDYGCVYSFESGIEYAFQQYSGITRRRVIDDMVLSREMDFLECFLDASAQADHPYLFSTGIEMNGVWPDIAAINRHFMEMLVRRARTANLAFTTASTAAEFMRAHYTEIPESIAYLPDVFAGMTNGEKPPLYPDTMEVENARFRAIFRRGETLPYAQYDYTERRYYPDWGNDDIPRRPDGYPVANTDDRFRVTPAVVDTRAFTVKTAMQECDTGTRVAVEIAARTGRKDLALALWDIPRTFTRDAACFSLSGAERFIPVRAPYTQNLCGILVADVNEGSSRIELVVSSPPRAAATMDLQVNESVKAKVFERGEVTTAYLFVEGTSPATVDCSPQAGDALRHYPFESDEPRVLVEAVTLTIEPGKPQRITGLRGESVLKIFPGAKPITQWTAAEAIK